MKDKRNALRKIVKERIWKIPAVLYTSTQRLPLSANWRTPRFDMNPCLKLTTLKTKWKTQRWKQITLCKIWGSHSCVYTTSSLLWYNAMSNGSQLSMFRKSLLPPSLGPKMEAVSTYTPLTIYKSIWRHNPQGLNLQISFFKQPYLMFPAPGACYWTVSMEIHKTNTHVCIVTGGQLRLIVWRPAKPLTSRLPELSRMRREHSRDTQHWLEQRSKFEACNKHCKRSSDSENWTGLSRRFSVCGVQQSDENCDAE